jgi:hypothetical protein
MIESEFLPAGQIWRSLFFTLSSEVAIKVASCLNSDCWRDVAKRSRNG